MKKSFLKPEISVSRFSVEDIITTSAAGVTAAERLADKMDTEKIAVVKWDDIANRE